MESNQYRGIYAIKPWWQHRLSSLEKLLIHLHVHPDVITFTGVIFAFLMGSVLFFSAQQPLLALAVAPIAIGRLAANALDGLVARDSGLARPLGEVFNECCDRLADILVFVGLALNHFILFPLCGAVLLLMLFSSYLGVAGKAAGGKRQFGGLLAKADRMIYLALFCPVAALVGSTAWNWLLWAFLPAILITIAQRARWITADLKQA